MIRCDMSKVLCVFCVLAAIGGTTARALINPNFTPIHLIEQSEVIVQMKVNPAEKGLALAGDVKRVFKGGEKAPKGTVTMSFDGMPDDEGKEVVKAVKDAPDMDALLFIGAVEKGVAKAFLHYGGQWVELASGKDGIKGTTTKTIMEQTWAGSTDMLAKGVEYALKEPQPDFPSKTGAEWRLQKKVSKLDGKVFFAQPVRLDPKSPVVLHLGMEKGDRIYRWKPGQEDPADATAELKLAAKSLCATWGDFDGDGKYDLVSWDGSKLWLSVRKADGIAPAKALDVGDALKDGCVSLALVDVGTKGRPGLVAGTGSKPVLITIKGDGSCAAQPLQDPNKPLVNPGKPGPLVVADLDGDALPDVLQMFSAVSLFFKGKGAGLFEKPVRIDPGCGDRGVPFTGDYDGDGRLDIFCAGMDKCRLWQNEGGLKFTEWLKKSGEAAYKCGGGAIGGTTCDFNNDGRQDIFVAYCDQAPQLFFNRGFRSFGDAREITPDIQKIEADDISQQAGCLGDFDGDGTQDMMLVMKGGELLSFMQKPDPADKVALNLSLPADGYAGPVAVTGYLGGYCFGAQNVTAGAGEIIIGQPEPRAIKLKWQLPGEKPVEKEVMIEKAAQTFVIR